MEHYEEIYNRLERIEDKVDCLTEFKISSVVNARWVSLIVSSVCGLITMVATSAITYFTLLKTK